jgi:hypothetical protein
MVAATVSPDAACNLAPSTAMSMGSPHGSIPSRRRRRRPPTGGTDIELSPPRSRKDDRLSHHRLETYLSITFLTKLFPRLRQGAALSYPKTPLYQIRFGAPAMNGRGFTAGQF